MSFLTSVRKAADSIRSVAGPAGLGIRLNQLTVRRRTWTGRVGIPPYTDVDLVLPKKYPIRQVNGQEIFSSGGKYEQGDIVIDHITPSEGDGVGWTAEQLMPTVTTDDVEIIHIITGSHPGEYTAVDLNNYRPFTTKLVLRKRG